MEVPEVIPIPSAANGANDNVGGIVRSLPIREKSLIERIRRRARRGRPESPPGSATTAPCCACRTGHEVLVTTDFTLENVHFRRDWHPPEVVGRRCLTRGLSDIAAMGGEPRAAFLSLALDRDDSADMGDRVSRRACWKRPANSGCHSPAATRLSRTAEFRPTSSSWDRFRKGKRYCVRARGQATRSTSPANWVARRRHSSACARETSRAADYARHFHPVARVAVGQWLAPSRVSRRP